MHVETRMAFQPPLDLWCLVGSVVVDDQVEIQALDRTQPGLPMKKGRAGTMTHDYKRHGTTTLFAALNVLDGKVIGQCMKRHRHQEFIRFLNRINGETPKHLDIHLIVDNYAAHKTPEVKRWLKQHRRFHLHFTPTSASWLNLVERFFAEITRKRIRRRVPLRCRPPKRDQRLSRTPQRRPQALRLDGIRHLHHQKGQAWKTSVGIATLA